MSNPASPNCPQCGAALPAGAPGGLCPRCLMALNLKTETVFSDDTPAAQPPLPPDQIAPHFPQLEILECLGRGGMGVVYKARQKTLNRFVALKLLAPERVHDAKFAERFAREAQALAALNHPNIVTIHDFGQAGGFYFLLMEFVDGVNLRQLLRARKFTPEEALAIVPPLCDALQFAHERGIVHRDIKPENLLLDKTGRVKVADFGIAKMLGNGGSDPAASASAPDNATKTAMGTPGYSAPEQKSDPKHVDNRADIYSLGVVFYEMLTGELPGQRIEPPSRKVQIDVRLDQVVLRALEKTPELRFQQASEVKTCVETIAAAPNTSSSRREEAQNSNAPSQFSGTALLGAWLIVPFLLSIFFWDFGRKGGTAALVGCAIASLGLIAILGTTFLGWIALGQIRRSNGRLRGLKLAMLEGLLLPELLVNTALIFLMLLANKLLNVYVLSAWFPALRDSAFVNMPHYIFWLLITAVVVIGVDYSIINRVWRWAGAPVIAGPATPPQPVRFWQPGTVGMGVLATFILLLMLLALLMQPFIINTDAAAPELPRGSHFLVWKWTRNFAPGDLVAYHHANWDSVGRVSGRERDGLMVNRNGQEDVLVPYGDVIGKVISVYWRASNNGADSGSSGFLIGQASFPQGDFIEITSLYRTRDQMVVKGHYHLVSQDQAILALFLTTTNAGSTPVESAQQTQISKSWGDFSLTHNHVVPGLPHLAMYAHGHPFANLYFGNPAEVAAERKLNLELAWVSTAGAWTNWNNHQDIGSFYAVAATPRETVAVGIDGRLATRDAATGVWQDDYNTSLAGAGVTLSNNAATGAGQTMDITGHRDFRGIIYAHGQYVVVREGGSIMTSPDGLAWTTRTSPVTNNLLGVFWDGHQYLIGGDKGTLLASPDGATWMRRDTGSEIDLSGFSYSGTRYVVVGNDGIIISDDGLAWRKPATWAVTARVPFIASTWTGSEFLACGLGLDKTPTIYTSPDGETWTLRDSTITASLRAAITVGGAIYVAGDSVVAKSTDGGTTWTNIFPETADNRLFMGLANDGQNLIAAGFNHNVWARPLIPTVAVLDTWAPSLAPGEKPDLAAIRNDIKTQMDATNYAAALQRQLWYFSHALGNGESDAVRQSFGVMNWAELGQKDPASRQALVDLRDQDLQQFSAALDLSPAFDAPVLPGLTPGSKRSLFDLYQEISALNRTLDDNDGYNAMVKLMVTKNPAMARHLGYKTADDAFDTFVKQSTNTPGQMNPGNGQAAFDAIRKQWEYLTQADSRVADIQAQTQKHIDAYWAQQSNRPPRLLPLRHPPRAADTLFVDKTRQLIALLVANGHEADAEKILAQALALHDDPWLKSAVTDAQTKLQARAVVPGNP